jgi:hypothetical protein
MLLTEFSEREILPNERHTETLSSYVFPYMLCVGVPAAYMNVCANHILTTATGLTLNHCHFALHTDQRYVAE